MVSLEPWFLGLICGLGAVIFILLIAITILCCRWSRKDKRKAKKNAEAAAHKHTSFTDIVAEQERKEPEGPRARVTNPNWFMQESQTSQTNVEPNGRRKISGQGPFTVGSSLIPFSHELDKTGPSLMSQHQSSSGLPAQQQTKTPENEEKMIRLGLIPPRQIPRTTSDLSGKRPGLNQKRISGSHIRSSSGDSQWNTSGNGWATSEPKGLPLASGSKATVPNGIDAQINQENNWVSLKDQEMQIWERSSSAGGRVNGGFKPYVLPKEDYDLRGAKWYDDDTRTDPLYESHVQRLKEKFSSPKRTEQQAGPPVAQKPPPFRRSNSSGSDFSSSRGKPDYSNRLSSDFSSIWQRIPEDSQEVQDEKRNRARRLGVPILPD